MMVTAPPDHPALAGHFPGNPLIPGVVLLEWAWQAARALLPATAGLAGIPVAKFLLPVRPGAVLEFSLHCKPGLVDFVGRLDGQIALQGSFKLRGSA